MLSINRDDIIVCGDSVPLMLAWWAYRKYLFGVFS